MTSKKFEEKKSVQNLKLQTIGAFLDLDKCNQNDMVLLLAFHRPLNSLITSLCLKI